MSTFWALFNASNVCVGQIIMPGTTAPTAAQGASSKAVQTARQADLLFEVIDPTTGVISEDAAKVEAILVPQVKAESERRRMLIYTPNRGKMKEYQAKKQEVLDFRALTQVTGAATTVLNSALSVFGVSLDAPTKQRKFPFAMAEAQLRGETIAQTIARYEAGMAASDGIVATLAADEQKAVSDIKAATTAAAKRAVYASINWSA